MRWVLFSVLGAAVLIACAGLVGGIGALWSIVYFGFIDTDPGDIYGLIFISIGSAVLLPYSVRGIVLLRRNEHYRHGLVGKVAASAFVAAGAYLVFVAIVSAPDRYMLLPGLVVVASPAAYLWLGRIRPLANE